MDRHRKQVLIPYYKRRDFYDKKEIKWNAGAGWTAGFSGRNIQPVYVPGFGPGGKQHNGDSADRV